MICSLDLDRPLLDPLDSPSTGLNRLIGQSRQGTILVLTSLAIAGWILPILAGTAFFLHRESSAAAAPNASDSSQATAAGSSLIRG